MLGIVLLWLTVYLTGMLLCKIGGEKETSQLWIHLTGFFFLFLIQGVVFTAAQFLDFGFSKALLILVGVLGISDLLALLFCRREVGKGIRNIREKWKNRVGGDRVLWLMIWLWLGIFLVLSTGMVGNRQDALLETMQTTLATDTINRIHPFTGRPMELGIITSKKILTLPFWYAALCRWTGFTARDTVWVWGSFFTVTFSLMAFTRFAGYVTGKEIRKNWLFVILLELLILSGDYVVSAAGYRLLFYGYSGETIVGMVALPMLLCVLYRVSVPLLGRKENRVLEKDRLGVWGTLVKLVLLFGASLFLAPLLWGPVLLFLAMLLFGACLGLILWLKPAQER